MENAEHGELTEGEEQTEVEEQTELEDHSGEDGPSSHPHHQLRAETSARSPRRSSSLKASPTRVKRTAPTSKRRSRCSVCDFEWPTEGCACERCSECCGKSKDTCKLHREADHALVEWVEKTKSRQELIRGRKKVRQGFSSVKYPETSFDCIGDTVPLFCFSDFVETKAFAEWKQPSNLKKTSSRGWTEADKKVVHKRGIPCRKKMFASFLEKRLQELNVEPHQNGTA